MIHSVRFDEIHTTNTYLYFASNAWVPSFARCRLTNDSWKNQRFLSFCEINATKFGSKNWILHTIIYHYVTSYGYIVMIIIDSWMLWFHFHCIMQLKISYYIATNVSSRKNATTFGDFPDCIAKPRATNPCTWFTRYLSDLQCYFHVSQNCSLWK